MISFALMTMNKLPESFYSFTKCSFEGRKDLQTVEVEASPSPLVFTEVNGIAAIMTDKAERDGNSSEERRNHTARP